MKLLRNSVLFTLFATSGLALGQAKTITKPKAAPAKAEPAPVIAPAEPAAKSTPVVYGHVWGSYSEDDMSVSEAVIGLRHDFDATYSGDVSYMSDGAKTSLHSANIKASNVLGKDSLTVGLQPQTYLSLVESSLGTRWLGATLAEATGLLPARDAGFTYSLDLAPVSLAVHARNDLPKDKHHTYGALLGFEMTSWLKAVLEAEHSALTEDRLFNVALLAKGEGLSAAIELAHKDFKEDEVTKDFSSFGVTADYLFTGTKVSVYGQFLSGDDEFKKANYEHSFAVGPTLALNDNVKAALLFQTIEPNKDSKEDRKDGLVLKGSVTL